MARIRSLHPGIFTDDEYMSLSFPARELLKGLWCEADDSGVFELKVRTLKARIMPADAVDMDALLTELEEHRFFRRFDVDGRWFGAVRNFRVYQRPKKPSSAHPLPDEFRSYVGLGETGSEPVPHQDDTDTGNPPQMEDGGDKMEDEGDLLAPATADAKPKAKRGTQIQEDWRPSDVDRAYAAEKGNSPSQIDHLAEQFRDHHKAKGTVFKDWPAGWRTWVNNDLKFHGDPRHRGARAAPPPRSVSAAFDRLEERLGVRQ